MWSKRESHQDLLKLPNGLIPGRAYNISVQTINERVLSDPTTAQDQTVPWRPNNVYFDPDSIGPDSFEVIWSGPREFTELHIFSSNL